MHEALAQVVSSLGLSSEQAKVYLTLVDNGPQIVSELAKKTQVQRTYIYAICRQMIEIGLVKEEKQGKITRYSALSPDRLLDLVESKKTQLNQTQMTLEGILPTLKSKYAVSETKPIITTHEGVSGVKRTYLDTLKTGMPLSAIVETSEVHPAIYKWLTTDYVKQRIRLGISVKALVIEGNRTKTYVDLNKIELRETKIVSQSVMMFTNELIIYGDRVALVNHKNNYELFGIIIQNQLLAQSFRSWFDLTWSNI